MSGAAVARAEAAAERARQVAAAALELSEARAPERVLEAAAEAARRVAGAEACTASLGVGPWGPALSATAGSGSGGAPGAVPALRVPLTASDVAEAGSIELRCRPGRGVTPDDERAVREIARLTSAALRSARALVMHERSEARARFIAEASAALARSLEADTTLREVLRLAVPALADHCVVDLLTDDGGLVRAAGAGGPGAAEALARPATSPADPRDPVRAALARGRPVVVREIERAVMDALSPGPPGPGTPRAEDVSAVMSLPMVGRRPIGVITLVATGGRTYDDADLETAEEFARRAGIALDNARLYERAEYQRVLLEAQGEASVDGLLVVGPDGALRAYNQRFLDIWQMPGDISEGGDERALAMAVERLVDPDGFLQRVRELYARREAGREELRFRDDRTIERYGAPVTGPDGTYHGYLWSFRDITERTLGDEARELTRTIAENATSALFLMDERGHPTYMNRAAEEMTGYTLDEIRGRPLHHAVHHTRPDGSPYPIEECPIDRALPQRRWVEPYEDVFVRKDGAFFAVRAAASPIVRDGTPVGTVVEIQDITEERRAREDVEKFVSLVDASTDFVGMAGLDLGWVHVNPAGCELVGLSRAEVAGARIDDLLTPETAALFAREAIPRTLRDGSFRGEWTLRHRATGKIIPVEGTLFLVRDPQGHGPLGIATVQRDIRERVQREAERTALLGRERLERERQALLADLTHALEQELGVANRFARLARMLVPQLGDVCVVDVVDGDGDLRRAACAHADAEREETLRAAPRPRAGGVATAVLATGQPVLRQDVTDRLLGLDGAGLVSLAAVPLRSRGRSFAVLSLATAEPSERRYGADDLARLEEVGRRAGLIIDNAMLFENEERARRRLAELHQLAADLSGAVTRAQVAEVAGRAVTSALGADRVWLSAAEDDGRELAVLYADGYPEEMIARFARMPLDASLPVAEVAGRGAPLFFDDGPALLARYPELAGQPVDIGGAGVVPLGQGAGQRPGALAVAYATRPGFGDDDRRQLVAMARLVGQALARAERYETEHELSTMLQRSLLPATLPSVPGLALASHYSAGAAGTEAGGDWYDALALSGGRVAVTVGDVVGRGPGAAAVMGQLRSALNAYLSEGHSPGVALRHLNAFAARLPGAQATSAVVLCIDPATRTVVWSCAGHPPPLVVDAMGTRYLEAGRGPILGILPDPTFAEGTEQLAVGSLLLVFSDGLFERRGEDLTSGLTRLAGIAGGAAGGSAEAAIAHVRAQALAGRNTADDVVAVAVAMLPEELRITRPADPGQLTGIRRELRAWLAPLGLPRTAVDDLVLALGEATANAVEHAYRGDATGVIEVVLSRAADGDITMAVDDRGAWRPPDGRPGTRGRGLMLMRAVMREFSLQHSDEGTQVRMRYRPATAAGAGGSELSS